MFTVPAEPDAESSDGSVVSGPHESTTMELEKQSPRRPGPGAVQQRRDLAAAKPREGVEVLRGDPNEVAALADTLEFEHRYTGGLIAWAPDGQPTDAQIGAVLDAFEKTA